MSLNIEQRINIIKWYYPAKEGHSARTAAVRVQDRWRVTYPNRLPPTTAAILKIIKKFELHGDLTNQHKKRSGRSKSVVTVENAAEIHNRLLEEPTTSQRQLSREFGICRRSIQKIVSEIGLKRYRPRLIHSLNEDDPDRRLQFCEEFQNLLAEEVDPNFLLDRILWSDEAKFHLCGRINRHNCVYYSDENPHVTIEKDFRSPGINVWAGIWSGGIIGPFFIDVNITGDVYLTLLEEKIMPALLLHCPPDVILQQDGAPPHYAVQVRQFLDNHFHQSWIGRRGPIEWPARSCDLTPMDFSVWGIVRDLVYLHNAFEDVETLKVMIEEAFLTFTPELCSKICRSFQKRLELCTENGGHQFEHLMR